MYYLYIVECIDKTLYTGITTDLDRRLEEHNHSNKKGSKYVMARRPVNLIFSKKFIDRSTATKEESRIKKLTREEKLRFLNRG